MDEPTPEAALRSAFEARFGRPPALVSDAGGRVNLIGEHTDYHEGFVLPAAIDLRTHAAGAPRSDDLLHVYSEPVGNEVKVSTSGLKPWTGGLDWRAYVLGPFWALLREGWPVPGADILIRSDVPFGSGLSSSASVQVALVGLGAHLARGALVPSDAARLARRAENDFCHVPCGIMDQLASACGRDRHAIRIDCRTGSVEPVPLPPDWALVVADSGVKHSVAGEEYAKRQRECEAGMAVLRDRHPHVRTARDVDRDMLEAARGALADLSFRRLRHVVTENERVLEAQRLLASRDPAAVGALLAASHESLASDYDVSCPELDTLVDIASTVPGVLGARLTGAGWGGNTVNLVRAERAHEVCDAIRDQYARRSGRRIAVRVVHASRGWIATPQS